MSRQFGRKISVQIGSKESGIDVSELRIKFDITKNIMGAPDICKLQIFNLNRDSQNKVQNEFDTVIVNAGYKDGIGQLFQGQIRNVFRVRDGVNMITEVYAGDGDQSYKRSVSSFTVADNATVESIINIIIQDMSRVELGVIDIVEGANKIRGKSFSGASRDILTQLGKDYNFNWSIQNGLLNCVDANSVLPREAIVLNNRTGMIGAPTITARGVNVSSLLNSNIAPHALIKIESQTDAVKFGNLFLADVPETLGAGTYKVGSVNYVGDTHGQEWYSHTEGLNIL